MMHMFNQDNLDQELGQNILVTTNIQVEEIISVQNQHQYMDQFITVILIVNTQEVTPIGYHMQLLKN